MNNSPFYIFNADGKQPDTVLACVIDKEGHACVQIGGYGAHVLSALESIISGLTHQSKVPPELMMKAIINGVKGVEPTGVIDLGGKVNE